MAQKSVLNLTSFEFQFEFNFINILKRSQRLNGTFDNNNALDYPNDTTGNQFTIYYPEPGVYICRWTGSGTLNASDYTQTNESSGIYTGGGANNTIATNGRYKFTVAVAGHSYFARIRGVSIDNAVVCREDEEALYDAGQRLRPRFKTLIAAFNPDSLRFMDMQSTNLSMAGRDWADMPSVDRVTYCGDMYYADKNVGLMTGTNDYTAAAYTGMPATYEHGEIIQGTFENANTLAAGTIDVGARGPKSVVAGYGAAYPGVLVNTGSNPATRILTATNYALIFDAYMDQWLFVQFGAKMGYPIPALINMCNETATPGYFCVPFYASDAWITSFANLLVSTYTPSFVKIAFCNEPWNSASGFTVNSKCARAGAVTMGLNGGNNANVWGYVGLRLRQIAQIMQPIFNAAGQGSKLQIVGETNQTYGDSIANLNSLVRDVFFQNTSTSVSGTLGTPSENLSGANAPALFMTHVSYAIYSYNSRIAYLDSGWDQYYNNPPSGVTGIDDVIAAADNWALGTVSSKAAALSWLYTNELNAGSTYARVTATDGSGQFQNFSTLATTYSLKVCLYEAAQEQEAPNSAWCISKGIDGSYGGNDGKIDDLLQGWFNSSEFERAQDLLLNNFYSYSQNESHSAYAMGIGSPWLWFPKQSATSTLGGDTTQEGLGNWRAHCKRNNGIRTFRLTAS